jgi:hypothetical protein
VAYDFSRFLVQQQHEETAEYVDYQLTYINRDWLLIEKRHIEQVFGMSFLIIKNGKMTHHTMIAMKTDCENAMVFRKWCEDNHKSGWITPGCRVTSLDDARPWLTSYGYYLMCNWKETSFHFDTTGPVGCFLSHRAVWQQCVERKEPIWVFEEGVSWYDTSAFDYLDVHHASVDLILGHTFPVWRMWHQTPIATRSVLDPVLESIEKVLYGTKCYRVSPAFAARLLEKSTTFDMHVDAFLCTSAIMYAAEFDVCRTKVNLVYAKSSGTINHSMDYNLLVVTTLLILVVLCVLFSAKLGHMYRRCRTACTRSRV